MLYPTHRFLTLGEIVVKCLPITDKKICLGWEGSLNPFQGIHSISKHPVGNPTWTETQQTLHLSGPFDRGP